MTRDELAEYIANRVYRNGDPDESAMDLLSELSREPLSTGHSVELSRAANRVTDDNAGAFRRLVARKVRDLRWRGGWDER